MQKPLRDKYHIAIVFALGAIVGLTVFLTIYGFGILNFTDDTLIVNGYIEKDIVQHYAGWIFYRESPWQFPLAVGQNLAYPYGSSITYTDSIPLFAVFFKLFRNILPETFQYFGIFVLLCFMLQGGFGALLADLFSDNFLVNTISAGIFTMSPVLIERAFRHCTLTAHFFILASLYFYFRNKGRTDFKAFLPFFVINAFVITIHPYFLPITFGIMFAFCAESFVLQKNRVISVLSLLGSMAITLFIGWAMGAFYIKGRMPDIGYGYYNMNLNAFYNPVSRGFDNWSKVLEIKPNMLGEIEGFNYLGLGVLIFIPVAIFILLFLYKKNIIKYVINFAKNHFGFLFSLTALTIFAIGDWVRFGGLELFRLPFPENTNEGIFGLFRANGRFGNLLVYTIVLFVIRAISRIPKKQISAVLCTVLLAIQIFDMRGALISKYRYFHKIPDSSRSQEVECLINSSFWDWAAEENNCIYLIRSEPENRWLDLAMKFAKSGKKVNLRFPVKNDVEKLSEMEIDILWKIENDALPEDEIALFSEYNKKYIDLAKGKNYGIYEVEGAYVICGKKIPDNLVQKFASEGLFKEYSQA